MTDDGNRGRDSARPGVFARLELRLRGLLFGGLDGPGHGRERDVRSHAYVIMLLSAILLIPVTIRLAAIKELVSLTVLGWGFADYLESRRGGGSGDDRRPVDAVTSGVATAALALALISYIIFTSRLLMLLPAQVRL